MTAPIQTGVKTADGLTLHVQIFGTWPTRSGERAIICLPGLTRNGRDFSRFATLMANDPSTPRTVVTIDSRGRGGSDRDPDISHYTVPQEADDVVTVAATLGIHCADFVGTSRGGLILHVLAAKVPDLLGRLVLNDIGPVIETEGLRQIQAYLDPEALPQTREAVIAGLKRVHGPSFPALDDADWEEMAEALYREEGGLWFADYDPAIARQTRALDLSTPLPDMWALFELLKEKPLAVIRGAYSALLSPQTVESMRSRHASMVLISAPGQGHAPLLHKQEVLAPLRRFLNAAA